MTASLHQIISKTNTNLFMPVGIYPGLHVNHHTIHQAVSDPEIQFRTALAMHKMFDTSVIYTGMDLSVEAQAYGCEVRLNDNEVPTVIGRLIREPADIEQMRNPIVGEGRTTVYLEAAEKLVDYALDKNVAVIGGMIGPFSLVARMLGVTEALEMSLTDPDIVFRLLEGVTPFLIDYAAAFRGIGAQGVMIAEPAAGLLSPRSLGKFSSNYVRQIVQSCQDERFKVIYHNCGARLVHLEKTLETNAYMLHFGAPMDIPEALKRVPGDVLIAGNLDPSAIFVSGSENTVKQATGDLLKQVSHYPNFILSTGCELPVDSKVENIRICSETVRQFAQEYAEVS